ncbi:MAG: metallophosphoesterase [bacterium]|nr:metallophosphoesterase [bacterium]
MKFIGFISVITLIIGLLQILLLWGFNRDWWRKRSIRWSSLMLPVVTLVAMGLWGLGEYYQNQWLSRPGMLLTALAFVLQFALLLSLPVSGLFHLINRLIDHLIRHRKTDTAVDSNRRIILKGIAAAVPLATVTAAGAGFTRSFGSVNVFTKSIRIDDLPPSLEGYRILHLSDLHLRHYTTLEDLEDVLTRAREFNPDLVLVTGDVADDLGQLPDALKLIEQFKAPNGSFATLGNHEYFRGVEQVKSIFDQSAVPLFINQGTHVQVGGTSVFIGGIDDPRRMGAKETTFFQTTIDQTLEESHTDAFRILMSHRPDAFDHASEQGIALTLAGHTHGGQIGFMGRSVFDSYWEDRYLWGEYRRGKSVLYTSSGVGHWFPFRLGCPPEAPVLELHRA